MPSTDYVWYACYGSNLSRDRFLRYIQGDAAADSGEDAPGHVGCSDPSPPTDDDILEIGWGLYFAGHSVRWGGGVAFLKEPSPSGEAPSSGKDPCRTLCRLYRITREQFGEVFAQENGLSRTVPELDYEALDETSSLVLGGLDYNRVLRLGSRDREPIYSFTSSATLPRSTPSISYLATVVEGLVESHPFLPRERIVEYLQAGVVNGVPRARIEELLEDCRSRHMMTEAEDGMVEVIATKIRHRHRREFIVQVHPEVRKRLGLAHRRPVCLSRQCGGRTFSVLAFVNTVRDPERPNQVALDQKLRVALGAPETSLVRISKPKSYRSKAGWPTRLLERLVGTQPELMRVERATFEDMEIPICRIPGAVFDVIGVEPGGFVRVESTQGALTIRAVRLLDRHRRLREEQAKKDPEWYPNAAEMLKLDEVRGGGDLPPVYLDLDARLRLNVQPCDVVRVVRDARHLVNSRVYLVLLPIIVGSLQVAALKLNTVLSAVLVGAILLASLGAVIFELRNKVT